jgi:hypothetical protein
VPPEQKLLFARKTQSEELKLPVSSINGNGIKFLYTNIGTDRIMIIVSKIITQVKPSHVKVIPSLQ